MILGDRPYQWAQTSGATARNTLSFGGSSMEIPSAASWLVGGARIPNASEARSAPKFTLKGEFVPGSDGYSQSMSSVTLIVVIVIAIVVIAAIVVIGHQMARRRQTERLQEQYGPEYDRAIDQAESQREAESELRDRSKRHEQLELRTLDSAERENFERRWSEVQAQFVDDPSSAVRNADRLVVDVMSARGYPVDDFDQRADDLSVRHGRVTQGYREARRIAQANEAGRVDTEYLRQAVTSYRSLIQALLTGDGEADPQEDTRGEIRQTERNSQQTTERETRA